MSFNNTNNVSNNPVSNGDVYVDIPLVEDEQGRSWFLIDDNSYSEEYNGEASLFERVLNVAGSFFKYISHATNEYPAGKAPAQTLQNDIILNKLMPLLSLSDCASMSAVCKGWNKIIQQNLEMKLLSEVVFGKKQWEQIPGVKDVGPEPVLTEDQIARLVAKFKGLFPFNNSTKRFWQMFKVILIPEKINGEDVDINLTGTIFSFEKKVEPENHDGTGFAFIAGDQNSEFRTKKSGRSYFLIVSLDVVPGSVGDSTHWEKEDIIHPKGFRAPNPLEAVIMIFVLNLRPSPDGKGYFYGGESLFWNGLNYTATDEHLVVGAVTSLGIRVSPDNEDLCTIIGVRTADPQGHSRNVGLAAVAELE